MTHREEDPLFEELVALPAADVDRIVEAVRKGSKSDPWRPDLDCTALGEEIGLAGLLFKVRRCTDQEPTRSGAMKHLKKLHKAASLMRKAFSEFENELRPGWQIMQAVAEQRYRSIAKARAAADREISSIRQQLRNAAQSRTPSPDLEYRLKVVQSRRQSSDRLEIMYNDFTPDGILARTAIGIQELGGWLGDALSVYETRGKTGPAIPDRGRPGHVLALRWIVGAEIPRIAKNHLRNGGKAFSRDTNGTASGPNIRFASAVLSALNIKSTKKTGESLTQEAIAEYWK